MQVKKFLAPSLAQALAQVKEDLGEEAVILHSRQVRGQGLLGWLRPPQYEVIAAKERQSPPPKPKAKPKVPEKQANPEPLAALEEEYQKLGKMVEELKTQLPQAPFTGHRLEVYEALIAAGYEAALAEKLLTACGEQETLELIWQALEKELAKGLKSASLPFPEEEPVVLALIGPTGVGKTTTIAKLAALYSLKHGYKVGLATVDTYRIGAVEQLRTYAEILDVPLEVALSTTELKEALRRLRESCEVIFLDTAGRSQQNHMQLGELKSYLQAAEPDHVALVLSGTLNSQGARQVLASFGQLGIDSLIVSKTDEVASFGPVASVLLERELSISCLTCGQAVPDDLQLPDRDELVNLCLRGVRR